MPRRSSPPASRPHRPSGQAVVTCRRPDGRRRDYLLGPYDSPASRGEYDRLLGLFRPGESAARPASPAPGPTASEALLALVDRAATYCRRPGGTGTEEVGEFRPALRLARRGCGHAPARGLGVLARAAVRGQVVASTGRPGG